MRTSTLVFVATQAATLSLLALGAACSAPERDLPGDAGADAAAPDGGCALGAPLAQINAGGGAVGAFSADSDSVGGKLFSTTMTIDTTGVVDAAPAALYQTHRYGDGVSFGYKVSNATPGGAYLVRLHFAEIFQTISGVRLFDASINGKQVLSSFDAFAAAGGEFRAVVKDFPATAAADGTITITLDPIAGHDNPMLSGLELFATTCAPPDGEDAGPDAGPDADAGPGSDGGPPVFVAQGHVFDVSTYGAPKDGTGDATAGVQAAITASACGDTIFFPAGTFHFASSVSWPACRMYLSQSDATLTGSDTKGTLVNFHDAHDIIVQGLTFAGGIVFLERSGASSTNILFDNNTFSINPDCSGKCNPLGAISYSTTLADSKITNNLFTNFHVTFAYGIIGYCYKNDLIANNEFIDIPSGAHMDAQGNPGDCGDTTFEQNYFSGIGANNGSTSVGPGMEMQTRAQNVILQDNYFEKPHLVAQAKVDCNQNPNNCYSYAFTVPLGVSTNTEIRRNTVLAPERPDGVGVRIGFEVGGVNTTVEDNYINGINVGVGDTDGYGTAALPHQVTVKNNFIDNALSPIQGGNANNKLIQTNNNPNVVLSWDIARGRPHRNIRY